MDWKQNMFDIHLITLLMVFLYRNWTIDGLKQALFSAKVQSLTCFGIWKDCVCSLVPDHIYNSINIAFYRLIIRMAKQNWPLSHRLHLVLRMMTTKSSSNSNSRNRNYRRLVSIGYRFGRCNCRHRLNMSNIHPMVHYFQLVVSMISWLKFGIKIQVWFCCFWIINICC